MTLNVFFFLSTAGPPWAAASVVASSAAYSGVCRLVSSTCDESVMFDDTFEEVCNLGLNFSLRSTRPDIALGELVLNSSLKSCKASRFRFISTLKSVYNVDPSSSCKSDACCSRSSYIGSTWGCLAGPPGPVKSMYVLNLLIKSCNDLLYSSTRTLICFSRSCGGDSSPSFSFPDAVPSAPAPSSSLSSCAAPAPASPVALSASASTFPCVAPSSLSISICLLARDWWPASLHCDSISCPR